MKGVSINMGFAMVLASCHWCSVYRGIIFIMLLLVNVFVCVIA
jgi:hypothetical protein